MSAIVLDAGALIALERNRVEVWGALKVAALRAHDVIVPSTVVAQVWRDGKSQARLARVLAHCVLASFDDVARNVGELCGRSKTRDVCDAHVALVAHAKKAILYTSDEEELRLLLRTLGGAKATIVRC
jgi:rRNA-processing protein FCF1